MGYDVLVAVGAVVAVLVVRAAVRIVRAWRRLRRHVIATLGLARRGEVSVSDASWWANQRDRRRMWRSIAAADRSVTAARSAGVPIGDLPSVVRQLRTAGSTLDAALTASSRSPEVLRQAAAVSAAADDVSRVAAEAVAADAAPVIARAIDAVRLELAALRLTH